MAHHLGVFHTSGGSTMPASITAAGFQITPTVWIVTTTADRLRALAGPNRTLYVADRNAPYGIAQIGDQQTHLSTVARLV